ncbi:MAG: FAD-dependent oxidoreductase [Gammaproteobacteria bacterium]|nr:FAD-dependent oxidoreductase [Gammaproteobacteria bacterium]
MSNGRLVLIAVVALIIGAYFAFDLESYLSLDRLRDHQATVVAYRDAHMFEAAAIFFAVYVAVTALSLPAAAIMTIAAGAFFGLLWGTVLVSLASTVGATLAFLLARFLFRDGVQRRFGDKLRAVNAGIARDGAFYLFTLRLVPYFPFIAINLLMALTPIRTITFFLVSLVGMFPGTVVYVNAGTQLAGLESLSDILSPALIASFTLLGLFPLIAKKVVDVIKARRVLKQFPRPERFERDMVVIGGGSAGLVSAYIGAAVKAKVTLVEKHEMGGDCLNTGCVPSKALIRSARFIEQAKHSQRYGIREARVDFDFADIMERVQRIIATIAPHDSAERYESLGVEVVKGEARVTSPWTVEIGKRTIVTRSIVVAAGGRPFVPPIPGIDRIDYLTSDNLWSLRELPRRLVVLGGGPIGCELAQAFARFGADVTQVEMLSRILFREDPDVSALVTERFREEGIDVRTDHKATRFEVRNGEKCLIAEHDGEEVRVAFDALLVAVGRAANTEGYGLEELGVRMTRERTLEVDEHLRSAIPTIYACGDVVGPHQFTHMSAHQAWYASVNALFGSFLKRFTVDYSVVPWATFTDPEVARVGLNEEQARAERIEYEVTIYPLDKLDRAVTDESATGMVKVLTVPGKDRILGVTIVGEHAGDVIAEYVAAMKNRIGLNRVLGTIHIYPTLAEANKYVAGEWKRAHVPVRLLSWLERYLRWRRG